MISFHEAIRQSNIKSLKKDSIEILQVNVGKLCNLTCIHCHVEAGPTKTAENMNKKTAEAVAALMQTKGLHTVDITGGAPEMNPHFKYLVQEAKKNHLHVIDRCNLTIFYMKGFEDIPEFLARNEVEIVASLPCYSRENVDKQRGKGTFGESIDALKWLNRLGYGKSDRLKLNLVYNPVGPHLPPDQNPLEEEYKKRLKEDFGIVFNHLFTITNMPITRYEKYLKATHSYEEYLKLLQDSFNPATLEGLMCKNTVSISWNGFLYDCDFNQMLDMKMGSGKPLTVFDLNLFNLKEKTVLLGSHCFACTAGSGSSCQGALEASVEAHH